MVYSMIFFDFLRFCIGATSEIPESVKDADWGVLYAIAKKQALIGVLFHGIQQLPKELALDEDLLMTWMGMAQRNMRFIRHYPSEAICEPLFRTWFFFWKAWHKV